MTSHRTMTGDRPDMGVREGYSRVPSESAGFFRCSMPFDFGSDVLVRLASLPHAPAPGVEWCRRRRGIAVAEAHQGRSVGSYGCTIRASLGDGGSWEPSVDEAKDVPAERP